MRRILLLTVLTAMTLLSACKQDTTPTPPAPTTSTAPASAPASTSVLASGSGSTEKAKSIDSSVDFNGDGKPDRYEVITTNRDNDGLGFVEVRVPQMDVSVYY